MLTPMVMPDHFTKPLPDVHGAQNTANYRPPERPCVGDRVLYYPDGDRNQPGWPGEITYVFDRSVDLVCINITSCRLERWTDVSFINDPRIRENPEVRRSGGWDFRREHYLLNELMERVRNLESLASGDTEEDEEPSLRDALGRSNSPALTEARRRNMEKARLTRQKNLEARRAAEKSAQEELREDITE